MVSVAEKTKAAGVIKMSEKQYIKGGDGFNPYRPEYHAILQELDDVD